MDFKTLRIWRLWSRGLIAMCAVALLSGNAGAAASRTMAITFDDLPTHGALPPGETRLAIVTRIIGALQSRGTPPVYGFTNGSPLEREPELQSVLAAWRSAGFPLGNHTWSHSNLNQETSDAFETDILRNEPILKQQMAGADWRWLRFPYLAEGETPQKATAIRRFLGARGYRIAAVTMDFQDYAFNDPYARCLDKGDLAGVARLERGYLNAAGAEMSYARTLSLAATAREIPYVLLLHAGAFDARMLPRLLSLYSQNGFRFISLAEAERDPFYRTDVRLDLPAAPTGLEAAVAARGLPVPPKPFKLDWLESLCR